MHMESGLEGISCLWKSFYKSGQDLSVNLSDYVNDAGSILLSTVQTKLIENPLSMKLLKSVHTASITSMFPLLEGNDINLVTTVFPVIENIEIHLKTYVFRKTDLEYPVFAHPPLVLKRDFEKNVKLQDDFVSRQIEKRSQVSVLDSVERTCVGSCENFFLLDRAEPLFFSERKSGSPLLAFRV